MDSGVKHRALSDLPRERWHWHLEGQLRFDNDDRHGYAANHVYPVGVHPLSFDSDVEFSEKRLTSDDVSPWATT